MAHAKSPALRVRPERVADKLRLASFILANHYLDASAHLRRAFGLGQEDVLILLTVAMGNVQRMLRAPDEEGLALSTALVDQDRIVPVSRRAVARAAGLPRETVRRRTNAMLDAGVLLPWGTGLRTALRLVLAPQVQDAVQALTESHAAATRALLRHGLLELEA